MEARALISVREYRARCRHRVFNDTCKTIPGRHAIPAFVKSLGPRKLPSIGSESGYGNRRRTEIGNRRDPFSFEACDSFGRSDALRFTPVSWNLLTWYAVQ